uniref:Uncharacterized protein n=1 Tax=Oryza punctata TaxID=4537 RepID=A0A0E0KY48_ORYPU
MRNEEIARMLLHDGCFIIKHLFNFAHGTEEELYVTRWSPAQLRIDLGLLENQIPFFVLEEIFYHLTPWKLLRKINRGVVVAGGGDYLLRLKKRRALLDMALWYMLQGWYPMPSSQSPMEYLGISAEEEIHHLLHLVHVAHRIKVDAAVAERRSQLASGCHRFCFRPLNNLVSG